MTLADEIPGNVSLDDVYHLFVEMFGVHMHEGYWDSPTDDRTLVEACLRLTDVVIENMRVGPEDKVIDIGCGIGAPAIRLARTTGASIVGINNVATQVDEAARGAEEAGVGDLARFQCADAMDLPFPENSFDAAWLIESILVMPDRLAVLRQAARVLRPGGRLVLTDLLDRGPDRATLAEAVERAQQHAASFGLPRVLRAPIRLEEYGSLIREAGMVPVQLNDISEHTTAGTFAAIRRLFTDEGERRRLVEKCGSRPVELYESTLPFIEAIGWGYGLVIATVPER